MASRIRTSQKKKARIQTPEVSTTPAQGMFESPPFAVESQRTESQPPDLNTALMRVQRYGHNMSQMQFAEPSVTTVQPKMKMGDHKHPQPVATPASTSAPQEEDLGSLIHLNNQLLENLQGQQQPAKSAPPASTSVASETTPLASGTTPTSTSAALALKNLHKPHSAVPDASKTLTSLPEVASPQQESAVTPPAPATDTKKAEIEGDTIDSCLTKASFLIDLAAPRVGDKRKTEFGLRVPIKGLGRLGFRLTGEAEREKADKLKVKLECTFVGGVAVPGIYEALVEAGGSYLEAQGRDSKETMNLYSYGLYRRFRGSKVIPSTLTNALWGSGKEGNKGENSQNWAVVMEKQLFEGDKNENNVLIAPPGRLGGFKGKGGGKAGPVATLQGELGAKYIWGRKYSENTLGEKTKGQSTLKVEVKPKFEAGIPSIKGVWEGKIAGTWAKSPQKPAKETAPPVPAEAAAETVAPVPVAPTAEAGVPDLKRKYQFEKFEGEISASLTAPTTGSGMNSVAAGLVSGIGAVSVKVAPYVGKLYEKVVKLVGKGNVDQGEGQELQSQLAGAGGTMKGEPSKKGSEEHSKPTFLSKLKGKLKGNKAQTAGKVVNDAGTALGFAGGIALGSAPGKSWSAKGVHNTALNIPPSSFASNFIKGTTSLKATLKLTKKANKPWEKALIFDSVNNAGGEIPTVLDATSEKTEQIYGYKFPELSKENKDSLSTDKPPATAPDQSTSATAQSPIVTGENQPGTTAKTTPQEVGSGQVSANEFPRTIIDKNLHPNPILYFQNNNPNEAEYQVTSRELSEPWQKVEQFCAYLATHWLTHEQPSGLSFSDLDSDTQQNAIKTLRDWSADGGMSAQEEYAQQHLGGQYVPKDDVLQNVQTYPPGTRIWFGTDKHAEAAVVLSQNRYKIYNPDTGKTQEMQLEGFRSYLSKGNKFVVKK